MNAPSKPAGATPASRGSSPAVTTVAPILVPIAVTLLLSACLGEDPTGVGAARPAATTVVMDFFHKPLPNIPLPNDVATRYDPDSATGRRLNASLLAPTGFERDTRSRLDQLDGWGILQPIVIPFSGPLDVESIRRAHDDPDYATADDVVYLIDIDPDSPEYGQLRHLDLGSGNYPVVLEAIDKYGRFDPRGFTLSLLFEEADEDKDGDGRLDPGEDLDRDGRLDPGEDADGDGELDGPEDTDADGRLDRPNYLPGHHPDRDDLAGRADALMTFYEAETHTLLARPLTPLRERTTYAVLVTRRLLDAGGRPVGSPYPAINHNSQTEALAPLGDILRDNASAVGGLTLDDVAFAFTFTTQSVESQLMAVRDGLYGTGAQAHLASEFPATIDALYELVDTTRHPDIENPFILQTEFLLPVLSQLAGALGADSGEDAEQIELLVDSHRYIDFHVVGRFQSPQLFPREDANGVPLRLGQQTWPSDVDRRPVTARPETVYFWLAVPRPEVSPRGRGEPAPLIVYAHGYTSNHFDALAFAGFFAQHGVATLAIDNVSHGMAISEEDAERFGQLADFLGLGPFFEAVNHGRAFDQDNDGMPDSGADFFSAYAFHTRDMMRQAIVDYMQLVRIVRTFDGEQRWAFDTDGDGTAELAGDFDGDGHIDIGGEGSVCGLGVSLGSMVIVNLGSLEPALDCIAAVLPGGGIADISVRSLQGGVPEAFAIRLMGPTYLGETDPDTGAMRIRTLVTSGNDDEVRDIAQIGADTAIVPGDLLVVENRANGERGCGFVAENGTVRAAVESDAGDAHRLLFYPGRALRLGSDDCQVDPTVDPLAVIDRFGQGYPAPPEAEPGEEPEGFYVLFEGELFLHGQPLVALADGLGLRRAHPELRRLVTLSPAMVDPADPAANAPHLLRDPLVYSATGETTQTHVLALAMNGDMSVPTSTAATLARAMGLLDYLEIDPRYGVPDNQVLIDTYSMEGVNTFHRHEFGPGTAADGSVYPDGVHVDLENFSEGDDIWGDAVPRLDPPLHLFGDDGLGGMSGFFFAYARPEGEHGFPLPFELRGRLRDSCRETCPDNEDCGCDSLETFDPALFYFNMIGHYLATGGRDIRIDRCLSSNDCRCDSGRDGADCLGWPDPPEERPLSEFSTSATGSQ